MTRSSEPIPRNVQHCRNLLQGTGYDVFKRPPQRWTERFNGHPLEAQAYFLTGYLARADKHVRQDLRDLILGVGIAMPPTVHEDGIATPARIRPENTRRLISSIVSRLLGYPRVDPDEDKGPGKTSSF